MQVFNSDLWILLRIVSIFTLSFGIAFFSMPGIISVSKKRLLLDTDAYRNQFHRLTPYLGGIGIYTTIIFVSSIFKVSALFQQWQCIIGVSLILFFTGLRNDLVTIKPSKRLLIHLISAILVVSIGDIRLPGLMGVMGIYGLSYYTSFIISIVIITFLTTSFSLIDSMNGLAGSLSLVFFIVLGCLFAFFFKIGQAMACLCIAGAIAGFLRLNTLPTKIFMGRSGSMVLGFFAAVMCLEYLKLCGSNPPVDRYSSNIFHQNGILMIFAIIIIPVMNTIRIYLYQAAKGSSSFQIQKKHIYYHLSESGLCPGKIILLLTMATVSCMGLAVLLTGLQININLSISIITLLSLVLFSLVDLRHKKYAAKPNILQ